MALHMEIRASSSSSRLIGYKTWYCCAGVDKICNRNSWAAAAAACKSQLHHHSLGMIQLSSRLNIRYVCPNSTPMKQSLKGRRIRRVVVTASSGPSPSLSDHILDGVSCFLLSRAKELPGSSNFEKAVHWLPPKLVEQILTKESFALSLVREGLVFGTLGLMYCQVSNSCRGLCRMLSATRRFKATNRPGYENSLFRAATAPLRLLITVWATTRMLRIIAISANLLQYFGTEMFVKARGIGIVVSGTWFLFRWKKLLIDSLTSKHNLDQPRAVAFDRLLSLVLYFVAATCIADIVGFALRSLLAVGGISGIALGMAAKEVVSNVFGGAVIFLTRPFVIGERIKAGPVSGKVQDIGYLQTKILGFDGVPQLVPNQAFIHQVITNFSRANSKLLEASFYLHNQDVFLVDAITAQVVDYLKTHPQVENQRATPMCFLKDMGHWGPEIAIMCSINFGGGFSFFEVRQEIMVQVAKIIVDVLGEDAPYFRNSVTNLMWELRTHLLYASQGLQPGGV